MDTSKMTAGFTMSSRVRPICISKFQESISSKDVIIQSKRLIAEMKVFIWKNGRAEAQQGYNDDLVMPFGVGQYMRETAFKFKQHGIDLTKSMLNNTSTTQHQYSGGYSSQIIKNPYKINNPYSEGGSEDIKWLL